MGDWIIEREDDESKWKKIGPSGAKRVNYYDKAVAEAAKRNRIIQAEKQRGSSAKRAPSSYPFYVVDKATGRVLSGWEYREDAEEALTESHGDRARSSMSVLTIAGVVRKYGQVSWAKGSAARKLQIVEHNPAWFEKRYGKGGSFN